MMNQYSLVFNYSLKFFIIVMIIALIKRHNFKIFFIQYQEGFNFVTGKPPYEFKDVHLSVPNKSPSITPYTKADIRNE